MQTLGFTRRTIATSSRYAVIGALAGALAACSGDIGDAADDVGGAAGAAGVAGHGNGAAGAGATASGGAASAGGAGSGASNSGGAGNAGNGGAGNAGSGGTGNAGNGGAGNAGNGGAGNAGNGGVGNAGSGGAGNAGNGGAGNAGSGGAGNAGGGGAGNAGSGGTGNAGNGGSGGTNPAQPGVVGVSGISAWDSLSASERATLRSHRSFFLHQSVGQDLEDGAEAGGFSFEWVSSGASSLAQGLNGGLFSTSNGNPAGKIAEFRGLALRTASSLRVAIMKFGYADIVAGKASAAQTAYLAAVNDIKGAGVRVLHVTPPFVYNVPAENATKMQTRAWMMQTFPDDVIFDLEDIESTEPSGGARCERGGSWEICNSIRSTSGCPSNSQGVDSASGQGHICYNPHARNIAKAFLYSIYLAAK